MTDEKVLAFPAKGDIPVCPVEIVRGREYGWCNHDKIRLNEHDRCVLCANCGATLDPFEYLKGGAVAIRRGW